MKRRQAFPAIWSIAFLAAASTGCVSSSAVDKKIADSQLKADKKIESVESQVEELQVKQKATEKKVDLQQQELEKLSQTSKDALNRAVEAGVLAKGKVVLQETFSEDRIRFKTGSYELDTDAKAALDEFAKRVAGLDKRIFLEIQGHTDNSGSEKSNDMLGQNRAESVRRYLARQHKMALGRISTISYGDTSPVEPNKTREGRKKNRRVVIVVLE